MLRRISAFLLLTILLGNSPYLPAQAATGQSSLTDSMRAVAPLPAASSQPQIVPDSSAPPSPQTPPTSTAAQAQIPTALQAPQGVQIITLPNNTLPQYDLMWRYQGGTWSSFAPPLPAAQWKAIVSDPFDSQRWLVLAKDEYGEYYNTNGFIRRYDGRDPLWLTTDGGTTWQVVLLPVPTTEYNWHIDWQGFAFDTTTPGTWRLSISSHVTNKTYLYRGSLADAGTPVLVDDASNCYKELVHLGAGVDGDTLLYSYTGTSCGSTWQRRGLSYVPSDSNTNIISGASLFGGTSPDAPLLSIYERLSGTSRTVVGINNINGSYLDLYATSDYRTTQVSLRLNAVGAFLTAAQDSVFIGGRTGILQIPDVIGAPQTNSVVAGTETTAIGRIRADRQTRRAVAAISENKQTFFVRSSPNGTWQTISVPSGASMSGLFEVLPGRGAFPADQELCPECVVSHLVHAVVGGPIDTRTGNLWTSGLDLSVTTPGPAITWERSYASQATATDSASLGYGWTHTYASRLITETMTGGEAGRVIVVSPKGNHWRYDDLGSGFRPWPGVPGTLIRAGDSYTQTLSNRQQMVFDAASGRLRAMRDSVGRTVELTYDATSGLLTHIEDTGDSSRFLDISYDTNNRIQRVEDPTGRAVTYTYSSAGDLETVSDVMQRVTTYHYQNHLLTEIVNALNQVVEQTTYDTYTPTGRAIEQVLLTGEQLQLNYQSSSTMVTTTGADGQVQVATYAYTSDDVLTDISVAGETVLATAANANFLPGATSDGNGNVTTTTYSSLGLPQSRTNALGQATQVTYDSNNRPVSTIDWQGIESRWRYDSQGNVISSTVGITTSIPLGYTTLYTYTYDVRYTGDSQLAEQATPDGVRTAYAYDSQGQVISSTVGYATALAQTTGYQYDSQGRVVTTTLGLGTALERRDVTRYNADNSISATIQNYQDGVFDSAAPDQDVITSFGYDGLGRQIWVRDVLGHYQVTRYTTTGQVAATARNVVPLQLDTQGQPLIPAFDASAPDQNVATLYAYDGLGRTTLVTETGILAGTFDPLTLTFSDQTTRVTRTEYDAFSRPVTVTLNYRPGLPATADTNVQTLTYYDGAGNIIWQRDAYGRWTKTEYDALNRPTRTIQNYEDGDPLSGARDADLIQDTYYTSAGQVERQIDNVVDSVFSVTEPITDRVALMQYDALGRLTSTTQNFAAGQSDAALNRTRLTAYDAVTGRVQGSRDVLGRWTSQQYDALGRVTSTIQNCRDGSGSAVATDCASFSSSTPDRNVTTATHYDVLGHAFETVDPLGVATRTLFDDLGRVTSTIAAYDDGIFNASTPDTDVTTQMAYDALGRVISSTDPTGAVTYQAYNGLGATTVVTDSVGRATQQGFDGQGALRWTRSPDGRLTVFTLDGLGRTITTITNYQDGTVSAQEPADQDLVTQTVYDIAGRHVQDIDTAGRVTQFAYDNLDRLIAVTENLATGTCSLAPCNVVTQYQYDRAGNRTAIIDANGHVRRFTYDAANQQIEAIDALNQTTGYSYDAAGRLIGTTDPRGSSNNLTYSYDDLDRQTGVSASNLGSIGQTYDARGQRLSMVDATGSTTFQYDQLGRVTSLSAPNTGTVGYGYDAAGMRTRLTYPDGTEITYAYDTGHQLQAVHQGTTDLATYTYDTVGRLATVARANSAVTTYGYDGADRLRTLDTTIGTSTVSQFQYTLDRAGLRTEVKEVLPQSAPSETPTPTATATATPTATATATIAATSTPTATPTATSAATNTPTATTTATNSPTATPVATNTPTATPSSGATFYRAINLNGTAQTIDGNAWEGSDATNYTYSGSSFCDQSVTLTPSTDTARTTMIRCSIWDNTPYVHLQSVPSGTYQVYLYVWEDNNSETFDIYFEGTLVENDYVSGSAGHWEKLGPWTATITDGTLAVDTIGGHANLSGIEVWQVSTGPTATPTVTATPTATSAATNTPTPTAAVPNTPTPTPSSGVAFYRAINLNGTAQTIDGNAWEGSDATNYTYSGSSFCNQNVALSPSTDTTRATMIRCSIWDNTPYVHLQSVPSGTYQVSLYVWEDNNSEMFDIYFEGTLVENDYVSGSAGHWEKLGPWTATVTDGTIAVDTIGGHANLSGIEVWQVSSGATNTPTPTSAGTTSTPTPTATSTPTGTPTSSGLVAAYNFDAGSGTSLADVTGNGHTGTLVNGPSWTTQGRYGDALSFDGENDLVSIADANDLDLTTDMTLEVWVYPTEDLQGWRSVLLKGQSVDLVYAIYANSDGDVPSGWVYIDGEKVATGTDALATNTWTHLATTFDGSTIRFYVNGTQVGSTSVSGSITVSDEALELGGDTVWAEFFTGRLDDVRIYNRALSATEIQSDMNTAVSGSSSLSQETVRAVAPSTNQASSQTTATKTQVPNDYPATRVHERAVQPHTESAFSESRFSLSSTSWMKVAPPDLPNSLTLNTILPQTAPLTTTRTITYTYDGLQRLTGAFESPGSSYAYTYDLAGNRIGVWTNGVQTQNLSYNAANQVSSWTYDAAGNLLNGGTTSSTYDALGRVVTLNGTSNGYNGDGVLVAQTSGSTTTNYAQDLAAPLSQILSDSTNRYIYGNGPERLFGVAGSTRSWYSTDALGTVRATLNDSGTVLASANYDPWGVPETGAIAPFGFNGELQQENDVYLRARWYQASAGSFVSRDSFEGISKRPYSLMPYQYAYAVPTVWADPSGAYACTLPTQYRTPAAIEYTQKYVAFCNEQRTRLDLSRKSGNLHAIRAIDALLYFFTDPYLPGGTSRQALQLHQARLSFAAERLEFVLWHAESGPFKEFRDEAVKFSSDPSSNTFDEGFAVELRDSQIWASSSRQVGHFLSAVAAGYSIIDESIAISCLVGHELVGDERFPYVNNAAQCLAGQYSIEAFQTAVRADASDDIALRDCVVANIVGLPELPNGKSGYDDPRFKDRVGNSRQDLRLTIKGWRLGRAIRDKQITLLSQITSWIYEEIHE